MADQHFESGTINEQHLINIYQMLAEIDEKISGLAVGCMKKHAHDDDVLHIMQGNGKPPLAVRLDRLEEASPRKEMTQTRLMAIGSLIAAVSLVIVDAVAVFFRK